jgi:hypothetical protein
MQQGPVKVDAVFLRGDDIVFGDEVEVERTAPPFEQILEGFAQHAFAATARYSFEAIEVGPVFVDQLAAQETVLTGFLFIDTQLAAGSAASQAVQS